MNTQEDSDDPYESSQMMLFMLNRNGMFGLDSLRSAQRYRRFVEAGAEFDHASLGPITLRRIDSASVCERARKRDILLETA